MRKLMFVLVALTAAQAVGQEPITEGAATTAATAAPTGDTPASPTQTGSPVQTGGQVVVHNHIYLPPELCPRCGYRLRGNGNGTSRLAAITRRTGNGGGNGGWRRVPLKQVFREVLHQEFTPLMRIALKDSEVRSGFKGLFREAMQDAAAANESAQQKTLPPSAPAGAVKPQKSKTQGMSLGEVIFWSVGLALFVGGLLFGVKALLEIGRKRRAAAGRGTPAPQP